MRGALPRVRLGEAVFAAALLALAAWLAVETAFIPVGPAYARVGPRIFPWLVAAALAAVGAALLWQAVRDEAGGAALVPLDRLPLVLASLGLIGQLALMPWIGFILATTLLFVLVAAAFGSRAWLRNIAIGLALAVVVYLGFTAGLGLTLPEGPVEGVVERAAAALWELLRPAAVWAWEALCALALRLRSLWPWD